MFIHLTRTLLTLTVAPLVLTSFVVEKRTTVVQQPKPAPAKSVLPGQAKKAAGSQYAKSFVPGQQKKNH